jgi:uncharacterized protein (TIGR00661 family)
VTFHLFAKLTKDVPQLSAKNLVVYAQGDAQFHAVLAACDGIVSTAGHGLLSEAMHLGIPVYAIPLPHYEQQMNASAIGANGFGVSANKLEATHLRNFIADLPDHASAIKRDRTHLLRRPGQRRIINRLQHFLR